MLRPNRLSCESKTGNPELICQKNCAVFSVDSSFLSRLQLSRGTFGARLGFRSLLRHVTTTLSAFQVMSLPVQKQI